MICEERGKSIAPHWLEITWELMRLQNSVSILLCRWRLCSGHSFNSKQWIFRQLQRWPVVIWAGYGSPWAGVWGAGEPTKSSLWWTTVEKWEEGLKQAPHLLTASLPKMLSLMTLTWARKANSWLQTSISHTGIFSVFYHFYLHYNKQSRQMV